MYTEFNSQEHLLRAVVCSEGPCGTLWLEAAQGYWIICTWAERRDFKPLNEQNDSQQQKEPWSPSGLHNAEDGGCRTHTQKHWARLNSDPPECVTGSFQALNNWPPFRVGSSSSCPASGRFQLGWTRDTGFGKELLLKQISSQSRCQELLDSVVSSPGLESRSCLSIRWHDWIKSFRSGRSSTIPSFCS